MNRLRPRHDLAGLTEQREVEQEAGDAHRNAEHHNANPEPDLLTAIELACGWVALAKDAAAGCEPGQVHLVGDVVPHPKHDHQQHGDREGGADVVVHLLAELGVGGEAFMSEHRDEYGATEQQAQAGDREHDEGDRGEPVQVTLERLPALDRLARPAMLELDPANEGEHQRNQRQRPQQEPAAIVDQRTAAKLAPGLADVGDHGVGDIRACLVGEPPLTLTRTPPHLRARIVFTCPGPEPLPLLQPLLLLLTLA